MCVFNDRTRAEVNVSFLQFILLTFRHLLGRGVPPGMLSSSAPPFVLATESLDLKAPLTVAQKHVMKGDSNSHLVGKQLMVTQGNFRSYQGRIKSTVGEKRVLVELKALLQRAQIFNITSLHIM